MALYAIRSLPSNIDATPSGQASTTTATITTTATQVLAANPNRKGFTVFNNSSKDIFLGTSSSVSTTQGFFAIVPKDSLYEWNLTSIYTGAIFAIANGSNGSAQVFELSP